MPERSGRLGNAAPTHSAVARVAADARPALSMAANDPRGERARPTRRRFGFIESFFAAGIAIGLRLQDAEPQFLVLAGFVASSIAIVIVVLSVYAPVFAGVVPSLEALGPSDSARAVIIFASLFLIPIHLVGCVAGYALADFLAPEGFRRGRAPERL